MTHWKEIVRYPETNKQKLITKRFALKALNIVSYLLISMQRGLASNSYLSSLLISYIHFHQLFIHFCSISQLLQIFKNALFTYTSSSSLKMDLQKWRKKREQCFKMYKIENNESFEALGTNTKMKWLTCHHLSLSPASFSFLVLPWVLVLPSAWRRLWQLVSSQPK